MLLPLHRVRALVAGATRGAGRGIAVALGGRRHRGVRGPELPVRPRRPERDHRGDRRAGHRRRRLGLARRCDLLDEPAALALPDQLRAELGGLDVLVNDVWGADHLADFGVPPWEMNLGNVRAMFDSGLVTHLVSTRAFTPLLLGSPARSWWRSSTVIHSGIAARSATTS